MTICSCWLSKDRKTSKIPEKALHIFLHYLIAYISIRSLVPENPAFLLLNHTSSQSQGHCVLPREAKRPCSHLKNSTFSLTWSRDCQGRFNIFADPGYAERMISELKTMSPSKNRKHLKCNLDRWNNMRISSSKWRRILSGDVKVSEVGMTICSCWLSNHAVKPNSQKLCTTCICKH